MEPKSGSGWDPIRKGGGVTSAERYLHALCTRSFLSLWSYPGVYRDQGPLGGKEVCDLLVVFGDDVLVFSDKDCTFPSTGDLRLDWQRWVRRAVLKAADQVYGAERWMRSHPDRLFLDSGCRETFPIPVPVDRARFHRIVVTHGASQRCAELMGGSGSLMLFPTIAGDQHLIGPPFTIGQIDPTRGYVHVLDDASLDILMSTLDTISDFTRYLSCKEDLIEGGMLHGATGEEDLLAYYLRHTDGQGQHYFDIPTGTNGLMIAEGMWEGHRNHPQRLAQQQADQISYVWDRIIEKFNANILNSTMYWSTGDSFGPHEELLRWLARESRFHRRLLSFALVDLLKKTPRGQHGRRLLVPEREDEAWYFFLTSPLAPGDDRDVYRRKRLGLLKSYCLAIRYKYPHSKHIVALGTETEPAVDRSEDLVYFDARAWNPSLESEARTIVEDWGLLKTVQGKHISADEYPTPGTAMAAVVGRIGRNQPCPCGSGRKWKKCCGAVRS